MFGRNHDYKIENIALVRKLHLQVGFVKTTVQDNRIKCARHIQMCKTITQLCYTDLHPHPGTSQTKYREQRSVVVQKAKTNDQNSCFLNDSIRTVDLTRTLSKYSVHSLSTTTVTFGKRKQQQSSENITP